VNESVAHRWFYLWMGFLALALTASVVFWFVRPGGRLEPRGERVTMWACSEKPLLMVATHGGVTRVETFLDSAETHPLDPSQVNAGCKKIAEGWENPARPEAKK
jgi:hypothetical protein